MSHVWGLFPTLTSFSTGPTFLFPPSPLVRGLLRLRLAITKKLGWLCKEGRRGGLGRGGTRLASGGSSTSMVLGVLGPTGQAEWPLMKEQRRHSGHGSGSLHSCHAVPASPSGGRPRDSPITETEPRPLEDWLEPPVSERED